MIKTYITLLIAIMSYMVPVYAQEAARSSTAVQYTVKSGDSADKIARKLLTAGQRTSLLKVLEQTQHSIELKPKDRIVFNIENNVLMSVDYGSRSMKKLAVQTRAPIKNAVAKVRTSPLSGTHTFKIQPGDSIIKMAEHAHLPQGVVKNLHQLRNKLSSVKPQDTVTIAWGQNNNVQKVSLQRGSSVFNVLENAPLRKITQVTTPHAVKNSVPASKREENTLSVDNTQRLISVQIKNDFVQDITRAGVPLHVAQHIHGIYSKDMKASALLRSGSAVEMIYTHETTNPIVYARLLKGHVKFEAVRFQSKDGIGYFNGQGKPYGQGFLRVPLPTHRISSHFSLGRKHPVLGRVRPHHGVDLAASVGTPVWASAAGKIQFIGYKKGFGRVIEVQHSPSIKTLYAHLSGFDKKIKLGAQVAQKQVIGYVGRSGLTTGPHLHYEYHINNQPRDPFTVALPRSAPLRGAEKTMLLASRQRYLAMTNARPPQA